MKNNKTHMDTSFIMVKCDIKSTNAETGAELSP